jgi:DNA-binding PadR family transcriptional regulator
MTDFAILGFLMYGPKSGYDIKRLMAMSTAQFYEASYGSIYPALERMAGRGLVAAERSERSGRLRRAYAISAAGRREFLDWLASPLELAKGPSRLLIRLFFMGCLEADEAKRILELFAKAASERRAWLETVTEDLPEMPDFFQSSTQRFGLEYYAFMESWIERLGGELAAKTAKTKPKAKEKQA